MTHTAWGVLLVLSILWGGSFFFVGLAAPHVPPVTIVLIRVALAALCLLPLAAMAFPLRRLPWRALMGMAVLNNVVPFLGIVWAQGRIPSGLAAILNATTPIFTLLIAHMLTDDERLTWPKGAGILLGVAGVVTLMSDRLVGVASGGPIGLLPILSCLAAALSYGFAGVYGRRFKRMGLPPVGTAFGQLACSTVLVLPVALWLDRPWTKLSAAPLPGGEVIAALIGLAVFSTALGYLLFFRLLAAAGAVNAMLVTLLIPPTAIVLGTFVLGEQLTHGHFAGFALIALGLLTIDGRWLRWFTFVRADAG